MQLQKKPVELQNQPAFGLVLLKPQEPVPLCETSVEVTVTDLVAEVRLKQVYINTEEKGEDGAFVLCLDASSVVREFTLFTDDTSVQGRMVEIEQDASIWKSSKRVISRSQWPPKPQTATPHIMFHINVGQLPKGRLSVHATFVTQLTIDSDGMANFRLPKYVSQVTDISKRINGSRIKYPMIVKSEPVKICADIVGRSQIRALSCISRQLESFRVRISEEGARLDFGASQLHLSEDLNVNIEMEEPVPIFHVKMEKCEESWASMVSVVPPFAEEDERGEYVFILDRSRGMTGAQFALAKNVVAHLIQSLSYQCHFNIVVYGSKVDPLFQEPEEYCRDLVSRVIDSLNEMTLDDREGSALLPALQHVVGQRRMDLKQKVFIISNGVVRGHSAVVSFTRAHRWRTRVFTLGIHVKDPTCRNLLKDIARAGYGTAQFVNGVAQDPINEIASKQLDVAKQQGLHGMKIVWNWHEKGRSVNFPRSIENQVFSRSNRRHGPGSLQGIPEVPEDGIGGDTDAAGELAGLWCRGQVTAPHRVPPTFPGSHNLIFTLFKPGSEPPTSVTITTEEPEESWTVDVDSEEFVRGAMIHTMAVKALVQDLEAGTSLLHELNVDEQTIDVEKIEMCCRYSVPCMRTAFVGIRNTDANDLESADDGVLIPPPAFLRLPSIWSRSSHGVGLENDIWRVKRKSVAKSFRIASIKLRFSVAYARFKGAGDDAVPRKKNRKLLRNRTSNHYMRLPGTIVAGDSGDSSNTIGMRSTVEKASITSKIKFFERQSRSNKNNTSPEVILRQLLRLQDNSGSFSLSESIGSVIGVSYQKLRSYLAKVLDEVSISLGMGQAAMPKSKCKTIWGSAVAVAYLYEKLIDLQEAWLEAAKKTESWLQVELRDNKALVDKIISMAQEVLIAALPTS